MANFISLLVDLEPTYLIVLTLRAWRDANLIKRFLKLCQMWITSTSTIFYHRQFLRTHKKLVQILSDDDSFPAKTKHVFQQFDKIKVWGGEVLTQMFDKH